jgi:arginase
VQKKPLYLIGYASGAAGVPSVNMNFNSADAPFVIQRSSDLREIPQLEWKAMILPYQQDNLSTQACIAKLNTELAKQVCVLTQQQKSFCVIGGDHACAIGTWSGVYEAIHAKGELGLIWIDAHMDSHTPETSESQRIHGMPLACLLGHGYSSLTSILNAEPKIKPQNTCLIGVRSFESGEAALLERLQVRVYLMEEVKARGLDSVLQEAIERVSAHTIAYGLSIDIDSLDPQEAPGVGVPEANGIHVKDMYAALAQHVNDPKWIATELAEFDPSRDYNKKTEKIIIDLLKIIANGEIK